MIIYKYQRKELCIDFPLGVPKPRYVNGWVFTKMIESDKTKVISKQL